VILDASSINVLGERSATIGFLLTIGPILQIFALLFPEQKQPQKHDTTIDLMLLKKCKKLPGIEKFVRKYFDKGEDMCNKCHLDWPDNGCDLNICQKANFDGLLFSPDYKYAYVVEKV
jgi:hypothetical protein